MYNVIEHKHDSFIVVSVTKLESCPLRFSVVLRCRECGDEVLGDFAPTTEVPT